MNGKRSSLPSVMDRHAPFLPDATPQARVERLEARWRSFRGMARRQWRGWEHYLALHSFYHFHELAFLNAARQRFIEEKHWEMALFYEDVINILPYQTALEIPGDVLSRMKRMAFAPRGVYKSTYLRSLIIWLLLHDPTLRGLYAKENKSDAAKVIGKIARDFEHNAFLREFFPEYTVGQVDEETGQQRRKPAPWGKLGILLPIAVGVDSAVEVEPNLSPSGVDVTETGSHYGIFYPDDLLTDQNSRTVQGRDNVRSVFLEQLNVMGSRGIWCGCGTFWTMDDVHTEMAGLSEANQQSALRVHVYRQQVSTEYGAAGESYYPKILPMWYLQKIRGTLGPSVYACLYDLYPAGAGDCTFDMAYTRYYHWAELERTGQPMAFHCIVDTAVKTKLSSDKTAILLVAVSNTTPQNVYQVTLHCKRLTKNDVIRIIRETYEYWHGHPLCLSIQFWMQIVAFEEVYKTLIDMFVRPHCKGFAMQTLSRKTTIPKYVEIGALQPLHFRGQICLRIKDEIPLVDCDLGNAEAMYPKLRPDAQILFRQMRDHLQDAGHQDDDAVDTLAQVRKILQSSPQYAAPKQESPKTPFDTEREKRRKGHAAFRDFEERRANGEFEGMDIEVAIAEYKNNYVVESVFDDVEHDEEM